MSEYFYFLDLLTDLYLMSERIIVLLMELLIEVVNFLQLDTDNKIWQDIT